MTFLKSSALGASCLVLFATACVHTPPHTSVEVALAKKAALVRMPAPVPTITPAGATAGAIAARPGAVEPLLPAKEATVEKVADAYSRGVFCLQAGQDAEAIRAFEEAVRVDPSFSDAWQNLAILYEKTGQEKKAMEAFRRTKKDKANVVSAGAPGVQLP